jgi:uncharacterized protein involved in exopolysaccharide biosynthesis
MATPRFDLVDIAQTLRMRNRFILIVTLVAAVLGAAFYLIGGKKYEAKGEFFVSNPLYSDRQNLFRTDEARFLDYFGGENDIDKIIAMSNSKNFINKMISDHHLAKLYKIDTSKPKNQLKLEKRFASRFDIKRTEYQSVQVSFVDTNAKVAARMTNDAIKTLEEMYRNYFNNMKQNVYLSLKDKMTEADSTIEVLTDTLGKLRDKYQVYDIISPTRQTVSTGSIKSNGASDFGKGIEVIQNVESLKDQAVKDRANAASLMREFSTGTKNNELPLLQVISPAVAPPDPKGLGLALTIVTCALLGLFFSSIWALLGSYFKAQAQGR